ncbi:MAG: ribosome maturation factor RimP [Cryobacterium sp.]|nr:ribosome maturation factor RimP [Oligoflexia bacterium]
MTGQTQTPSKLQPSELPSSSAMPAVNAKVPTAEQIFNLLSPVVEKIGYELVHIELLTHREKTLRVYIDLNNELSSELHAPRAPGEDGIGVEDCAIVSRGLDEPLENMPEVDACFGSAYELEVSSPGVDRPLRRTKDFTKFTGRDVRIHTLRALTAEELGNAEYATRNPKQKNFIGVLGGMDETHQNVKMTILASMGPAAKTLKKPKKGAKGAVKESNEKRDSILIPLTLISKANIEPDFEVD